MNDTGVVGTIVFLLFIWAFFRYVIKAYKLDPGDLSAKYSLAFSVGVFGLLISYLTTNGLWLPFSWIFFGFTLVFSVVAVKKYRFRVLTYGTE